MTDGRPERAAQTPEPEEPPPILGTWPRLYAALLLYLVALIALCAWFTRVFS